MSYAYILRLKGAVVSKKYLGTWSSGRGMCARTGLSASRAGGFCGRKKISLTGKDPWRMRYHLDP
jgi:hypothetical protein